MCGSGSTQGQRAAGSIHVGTAGIGNLHMYSKHGIWTIHQGLLYLAFCVNSAAFRGSVQKRRPAWLGSDREQGQTAVMAAPAVKTKLGGGVSGGVAILWRKWVKVSSVPADIKWGPYIRGRAIRAIWHSRWGPIGLSYVYGVVDNVDDNINLMGTVLKDNLSLGCQVMIGGDFNVSFQYLKHGIGAVSSCITHLDFGPTCFSSGRVGN